MVRFLLVIMLIVCSCHHSELLVYVGEPFSLTGNDRQIYSLLIGAEKIQSSESRILVIPDSDYLSFEEQFYSDRIDDKVTKELTAHFNRINADTIRWDAYPLDVGIPVTYIEQSEIDSIFNPVIRDTVIYDCWKAFYDKYPDYLGFYTFSKIAYNADSTVALASYSHLYGCCGGDWQLIAFTRNGTAWEFYKCVIAIAS